MSYEIVSSADTAGSADGVDMDNAWATLEAALEATPSAGDVIIVRRTHSEIPTSDIVVTGDGTASDPIKVIGFPRAAILNTTITEGGWTNGSVVVDNVVGITPKREQHLGRFITAPDGHKYLITGILYESGVDGMGGGDEFTVGQPLSNVTQTLKGKLYGFTDDADTTGTIQYMRDSASAWVEDDNITGGAGGDAEIDSGGESAVGFILDREYAGSTVTGVTGKFQIDEDEDYDLLTYTDTFQGEADDDKLTVTSHPYKTGDGPVFVHEGTTLPTGLAEDTEYWVIYDSATTIKLATSKANALAGTAINLTSDGTADNTLQTINDFGWTIQLTDYKADADDLPLIDFNETAYQINLQTANYFVFKNLDIQDSNDANGAMYINVNYVCSLIGCLLKTNQNTEIINGTQSNALWYLDRVIFEGSGAGSVQTAINAANVIFKNGAVYNMGDAGVQLNAPGCGMIACNVNIGVEIANGDADVFLDYANKFCGNNIKLGGTNGYLDFGIYPIVGQNFIQIENYDKVLGEHKTWYQGGTFEKAAVSGETPNKKVSDDVLKISPNESGYQFVPEYAVEIFCHEFDATTDSLTYKYWLYNNTGDILNSGDVKGSIWLELEYVNSHDDTTEYTQVKAYSTEKDIADAADADDWDYLQVATIQPAVASRVRIRCFCRHYTAAGDIYIDPAVVIS